MFTMSNPLGLVRPKCRAVACTLAETRTQGFRQLRLVDMHLRLGKVSNSAGVVRVEVSDDNVSNIGYLIPPTAELVNSLSWIESSRPKTLIACQSGRFLLDDSRAKTRVGRTGRPPSQ